MVESKRMVGIVSAGRVVAGYVGHAGGLESSTGRVSYLGMKTALGGFTRLCVAAKQQ
jgi:hypothetical protein